MSHVEAGPVNVRDEVDVRRFQRGALLAGVVGLVFCALGAFLDLRQFFQSYLWAYLFWLGLALGCFGVMMLQHLTGGRWGVAIRRLLENGALTLPLMALLFVPVVLGIPYLYEWSHLDVVDADPILKHKQPYLNVPFFLVRAAIYFVVWIAMALIFNRWSNEQDRSADPRLPRRFRLLAAPGLILYMLTMTFASFDWAMSLEPHWYSTIYGVLFVVGQVLTTFAFITTLMALLVERGPLAGAIMPALFRDFRNLFNDLGNLILAFVMLWAYMSFSQFLIIWSGNIPEEVTWYIHRSAGGWNLIAVFLALFHFALPLALLLLRATKRRPQVLLRLAVFVMVMQLINLFWLVMPAFHQTGFHVHWLDAAAPIGIGGLWIAAYLWLLQRRPLLAYNDHRWLEYRSAHGH